MTITLNLPEHVEAWLRAEAARRGISVEDYAISIIMEALERDFPMERGSETNPPVEEQP